MPAYRDTTTAKLDSQQRADHSRRAGPLCHFHNEIHAIWQLSRAYRRTGCAQSFRVPSERILHRWAHCSPWSACTAAKWQRTWQLIQCHRRPLYKPYFWVPPCCSTQSSPWWAACPSSRAAQSWTRKRKVKISMPTRQHDRAWWISRPLFQSLVPDWAYFHVPQSCGPRIRTKIGICLGCRAQRCSSRAPCTCLPVACPTTWSRCQVE